MDHASGGTDGLRVLTLGQALTDRLRTGPVGSEEAERMVRRALARRGVRVVGPCATCGVEMAEAGEPMWSVRVAALVCNACGEIERCEAA